MPRNDRSRRTASTLNNITGPSVGVRGARQPRAFQADPEGGMGALQTYLRSNRESKQAVSTALGNAADMAKRYELQQTRRERAKTQQANQEKAEYAAKMGQALPEDIATDPDAVHTFESTSGALSGQSLWDQANEEVVSQYQPGSGADLEAELDGWVQENLGKSEQTTAYNLAAYDSFMSKARPALEDAAHKNKKAVVGTQRAGLGESIRYRVTSGAALSKDWYDSTVERAGTLFPDQSDGWKKAWVLQNAMGSALRGGQSSRRGLLGLINTLPSEERPPEVDKVVYNIRQSIDKGWSVEGDKEYGQIQSQITAATQTSDKDRLYRLMLQTQDARRRWADDEQARQTIGMLNEAAKKIGTRNFNDAQLAGLYTGENTVYQGSRENMTQRHNLMIAKYGATFSPDDDITTVGAKAQQWTQMATNLHGTSEGMPDQVGNVLSAMVTNANNVAGQQGAVFALNGMDDATADAVLKGHPKARATFETLRDMAITDSNEFGQRAQMVMGNMEAFQQAHDMKLADWLGNEDITSEQAARASILEDSEVGELIAEAGGHAGAWGTREPTLSPRVQDAYINELRYQTAKARVSGEPLDNEQIKQKAAAGLAKRVYATPAGQGSGGMIGGLGKFDAGVVLGTASFGWRGLQGVANATVGRVTDSLGITQDASSGDFLGFEAGGNNMLDNAERSIGDALSPNNYQLRLRTAPRMGEVDGRPVFTSENFQGADESVADLMLDDLSTLAESANANYQIVEGDHAKQNYMTVQNMETHLPAVYVEGNTNEMAGPHGTFSFQVGGDPAATRENFRAAATKAGLPESVEILKSRQPNINGSVYEMVIGTRYPDDYKGAKKLRDAKQAQAAEDTVNEGLRQTRASLQSQGRVPPSQGTTNYRHEPEDSDPAAYMDHLNDEDLKNAPPGAADGTAMNDRGYTQRRFEFLANKEGLKHSVYQDTSGHPTVGYGFNMDAAGNKEIFKDALGASESDWQAVKSGQADLTTDEAQKLFDARIKQDEQAVAQRIKGIGVSDEQRLALVDLSYNAGPSKIDGDLVAALGNRDWLSVAKQMLFDTGTAHNAGLAARRWDRAKALIGGRAFDAFTTYGQLPDYADYQSGDLAEMKQQWS